MTDEQGISPDSKISRNYTLKKKKKKNTFPFNLTERNKSLKIGPI